MSEIQTRTMEEQGKPAASHILVVDDNPEIREVIYLLLGGEGYEVTEAANGEQAIEASAKYAFDLIILDIMMPVMNGYQTCVEIRKNSNAPILFLSAKSQEDDKMLGFSSGGDDYLVKPFSYNELVSRAKALIRRYHVYQGKNMPFREAASKEGTAERIISYQDIVLNETRREVSRNGQAIELTDTEYALLHLLLTNRKQIFSAEHLYESIWQEEYYYGANNTVMVHMRNLRCKIEKDPKNPTIIKTVWGRGYRCD